MRDEKNTVLEQIQRITPASPEEAQFLQDLGSIITLEENYPLIRWAPYMEPHLLGEIAAMAPFPNKDKDYGADSGFMARPLKPDGSDCTKTFYGVPIFLEDIVPLAESGLLERPIGSIRADKKTSPDDKLMQLFARYAISPKIGQDLPVTTTLGDVLALYEEEDDVAFDRNTIRVQRATIIIPTNPAYTTEGQCIVHNFGRLEKDAICVGYGMGDRWYRGRPVISCYENRTFADINKEGEQAFFNVEAYGRQQEGVGDMQVGNMVVMALPLVGETKPPVNNELVVSY